MRLEIPVGERSVVLETGKLAKQAGGSVTAQLGDTVLLSTATRSQSPRPGATFLPLSVDIEERMTAAGKIPGRLPQARGQAFGQGYPDLAAHGQAPQAALSQGLPLRDTGHRHRARRRPGHPVRHGEHGRGLGGAGALRHPVTTARSGPSGSGAGSTAASYSTRPTSRSRRATSTSSWPGPKRPSRWSRPAPTR